MSFDSAGDAMEKLAAVNATEMTNTVPAITQSGSATQGENTYSYYAPSIHGLGGSASNTTLVIVDGLRMPGGGTQFGQTDPNIIPSSDTSSRPANSVKRSPNAFRISV